MTSRNHLKPAIPFDRFLPAQTAFMARTDINQVRLSPLIKRPLDEVTGYLIGLLGKRPAIRHRAVATDSIMALFEQAGRTIEEDTRIYETPDQAWQIADELIASGYRLFNPYPLPENRFPDDAYLVPPKLAQKLNAKEHLAELVPPAYLPHRDILSHEQLKQRPFSGPAFIKVGGPLATGGGIAVRFCPDQDTYTQACEWIVSLGEISPKAIIEQALNITSTWCVALAVSSQQTLYVGAAEQVFSEPGKHAGNIIDPDNPFPEHGIALAIGIGETARKLGFGGIAGLDIGLTEDNQLVVFDPNFRIIASTDQSFLHEAATLRAGCGTSHSIATRTTTDFTEISQILSGPISDGWFIPTRLIDARFLPTTRGQSEVKGFVLGRDRQHAISRCQELQQLVSDKKAA